MFVDQRILEDLCRDAGATRKDKAIKYQKQGKVEIRKLDYKNNKNFEIVAKVHGTDTYNTYINIENGVVEDVTCTCPDYYNYYGICKHTLATVLEIANNPQHVGQTVDNDSEIEKIKERKIYIPRMIHPWKGKSFEEFVKKKEHRLEDVS